MIVLPQDHCPRGNFAWPTQVTSKLSSPAVVPLHLCTNQGGCTVGSIIRVAEKISVAAFLTAFLMYLKAKYLAFSVCIKFRMFLTIINRKNLEFFFHFTFKFIYKNFDKKLVVFFQTAVAAAAANFEE